MTRERSSKDAASVLGYLLVLGALIGAIAGYVEGVATLLTGRTTMSPGGVVDLALLYSALFGTLGLGLGLIAWALMRIGRRPDARRERLRFGLLLGAVLVFILGAGYANELVLPEIASREALVFDLALFTACALAWFAAFRLFTRRVPGARRPAVPGLLIACAAMGGLLLATSAIQLVGQRPPSDVRPGGRGGLNVLLLVVDAMRADHLGLYGYDRPTSPTIDRLGAEGVVFTNAYAQGSRTKEATASLVTSLYPSTHGVSRISDAVPPALTTIMERFHDGGYRTAVFSANPLVSPVFGFGRGVDRFYADVPPVIRQAIVPVVMTKMRRRVPGVQQALNIERRLERVLPFSGRTVAFGDGSAADLNRNLLEWIDARDSAFFAYVHYMEPHVPYAPPPPYDTLFDSDYEGVRLTQPPVGLPGASAYENGSLLPGVFENLVAQYDGSIACFDAELARLLEALLTRGLEDKTLIVITADHGEEFLDHGGWSHGHTLYQELIRVPLVLWGRQISTAPRVIREPVRHIDLVPTLVSAAGLATTSTGAATAGSDLWPALVGVAGLDPSVTPVAQLFRSGCRSSALVRGDMKVIQDDRGDEAGTYLFDLSRDPGELSDIASEHPEIVRDLLERLEHVVGGLRAPERPETRAIDESMREKLEALGYTR